MSVRLQRCVRARPQRRWLSRASTSSVSVPCVDGVNAQRLAHFYEQPCRPLICPPAQQFVRSMSTASRNAGGLPVPQHVSVPTDEFDELKQFLMDPETDGDRMARAKEIVTKMMHQHVYASMPGQEATVMVMVADAMEDYPFVLEVYTCLRDAYVSPSPITLEFAALACAKLSKWQLAMEIVEAMHQAIDIMHPSVDIYENAILACYHAKKWTKAKQLLDEMKTYRLEASPEIHLKCISLCIHSNEATATRKMTESFLQTFELDEAEVCEALETLFREAINAGVLHQALFFRDQLLAVGVELSKELYTNLIHECAVQRKWHQGRLLLSQFSKQKAPMKPASSMYTSDIATLLDEMHQNEMEIPLSVYNAALRNYGQLSMYNECLKLFDTMKRRNINPDAVSYGAVLCSCGTRVEESHQFYKEMESHGCKPTMDVYHAYLLAASRACQWQEVLNRYHCIPEGDKSLVDMDSRILSLVAVAYGRQQQHKNMLQIFTSMKVNGLQPNLYVYGEAMYAYIHMGQWRHALLLFDHLMTEGFEQRKLADFSMIWDAAVHASGQGRDTQRAAILYDTIIKQRAKISVHSAKHLIEILEDIPTTTLWESFKSMKYLHKTLRRPSRSNPKVLNALLKRAVEEKNVYLAEKLVEEAEEDLDMLLNSMSYSLMLRLYADHEDSYNFEEWCGRMADAKVKVTLFTFRALLYHLQALDAEAVGPSCHASIRRLLCLNAIEAKDERKETLGQEILDSLIQRGIGPDALCLQYYLCLSQDPSHTSKVLAMLEKDNGDVQMTSRLLHVVFVTLGHHPEAHRVRHLLKKYADFLPRALMDDALAAYCSANDAEEAFQLLQLLVDSGYTLEDQQVLLFLTNCVASQDSGDSSQNIDRANTNMLVPTCKLLSESETEIQLESSSMAFLLQRINELSNLQHEERDVANLETEIEAMKQLLIRALSNFPKKQVRLFLKEVVAEADFGHIESVLASIEED